MSKLAFPTSWGESNELVFRDGRRVVPEYLVSLMSTIDTSRYTYDQAIAKVNGQLEGDKFAESRQKLIDTHLAEGRDGRRDR